MPDVPMILPAHGLIQSLGSATAAMRPVLSQDIPMPQQALLNQEGGMTAALELFFARPMRLEVLSTNETDERLNRLIRLRPGPGQVPAELGLISIRLLALPLSVQEAVRQANIPFGRILADAGIGFRSIPIGFFAVPAMDVLHRHLEVTMGTVLFGRSACLSNDQDVVLADVVEILGPISAR